MQLDRHDRLGKHCHRQLHQESARERAGPAALQASILLEFQRLLAQQRAPGNLRAECRLDAGACMREPKMQKRQEMCGSCRQLLLPIWIRLKRQKLRKNLRFLHRRAIFLAQLAGAGLGMEQIRLLLHARQLAIKLGKMRVFNEFHQVIAAAEFLRRRRINDFLENTNLIPRERVGYADDGLLGHRRFLVGIKLRERGRAGNGQGTQPLTGQLCSAECAQDRRRCQAREGIQRKNSPQRSFLPHRDRLRIIARRHQKPAQSRMPMTMTDLRSDTVTRPTPAMRQAMATAVVGDDVFGDDPTLLALEQKVAELLGKEAALFVPSGVMANQIAVRLHARPGEEGIVHAGCHIFNYEGGAAAALSGVTLRPLASSDGTLNPAEVLANLHGQADPHLSVTRFIAFENTHNACGGTIVPQENIQQIHEIAQKHGLAMHLDGARLMNAVVATGRTAKELAQPFDTVSLCLSKGLGAPIGSVLAMPQSMHAQARRVRKLYGGGMRQAGILAAAGIYALDHHVTRLADDHRRARTLASDIAALPGLRCDVAKMQTNLVFFDLAPDHPWMQNPPEARVRLTAELKARGVLIAGGPYRLRAVTHLDVDDAGIQRSLTALREIVG